MAEYCSLTPKVKRRNGIKIEEKDSILFKDIKDTVKDNDAAWEMWAYTKTSDFRKNYGNKVEYDSLGEPTFSSMVKAMGLEEAYSEEKGLHNVAKDHGVENREFKNIHEAVSKAAEINRKEKKAVAVVREGKRVEVLPRNGRNLDEAKKQLYHYSLTNEIITLLNSLGFDVGFLDSPHFDGIYDPENASLHDELVEVIRIAKGEKGEEALPEEFAHLIIDGLINHPLVKRLLNTMSDELVKEILGDSYDKYNERYEGNSYRMKKEAAGQLLAQHIIKKGTVRQPVVQERKSLLSRVWGRAKEMFAKITGKQLDNARTRAAHTVESLYKVITSDNLASAISRDKILTGDTLYRLSPDMDTMEKIAVSGETIAAKRAQMVRDEEGKFMPESTENIHAMRSLIESENYYEATIKWIEDATQQVIKINEKKQEAEEKLDGGDLTDIEVINEIAHLTNDIDDFVAGYGGYVAELISIDLEENYHGLRLERGAARTIASKANSLNKLITQLSTWRTNVSLDILTHASRTTMEKDIVKDAGKNKDEVMELTTILDHAARDINFVDRWLSAMSDADDSLLVLMDGLVKNQQYERDMEMMEWQSEIAALDKELRDAGETSEFMYEIGEDGVPTGRIRSQYDWVTFNKEQAAKRKELRDLGYYGQKYYRAMEDWKRGSVNGKPRLLKIYVDPEMQKMKDEGKTPPKSAVTEWVPNPKVYDKNAKFIENLNPAQRKYYLEMIRIKRTMMAKIPHKGQHIYRAVYISKDFVEGILDNSTGNIWNATKEQFKKKFLRRPDDLNFGTTDDTLAAIKDVIETEKNTKDAAEKILKIVADATDDSVFAYIRPSQIKKAIDNNIGNRSPKEIQAALERVSDLIESQNYCIVDTDFAGHRVQKLPIYYRRKLKDMRTLSMDFSATILAYSAMAVNYEKMNKVVDILEVGRSFLMNRDIRETQSGRTLRSQQNILGKSYRTLVRMGGAESNIVGRYNDFMDSVVYEERKKDKATVELFNANVDVGKVLDTIKDYTGILGLGFNLLSTVSNIAVGKLQQWIEAAAGEYFTFKDYAKAVVQYNSLIAGCVAEMASPVKKNKLSLLIRMFDPMGEYYESLRDESHSKHGISRILGNSMLAYVGMNAGEHLLHCQTMLAILNNIKLINLKTKEKISLYDALDVVEEKGVYRLKLKDDLAYEREVIDNTGNKNTNKNYGRPLKDANGEIQTETVPLKDLGDFRKGIRNKAKDILNKRHGTYDPNEKPEINHFRNYINFIRKRKRVVRKVNDSLNGAFGANDKGAIHKIAVGRLIMQFRQWMPAHYMRRFARAHYDNDLEQWREGYYITLARTINQFGREIFKAEHEFSKIKLSKHEKANMRRACAEITEFYLLMLLSKLGGRVKDKDRSWLDKMALYQIKRMFLETGASFPLNTGFFSNIFTLLQSPMASINTFEKWSKIIQFWNILDEIESGRFQGWSEWERDAFNLLPAIPQIEKAYNFDDSLFSMFEKDN